MCLLVVATCVRVESCPIVTYSLPVEARPYRQPRFDDKELLGDCSCRYDGGRSAFGDSTTMKRNLAGMATAMRSKVLSERSETWRCHFVQAIFAAEHEDMRPKVHHSACFFPRSNRRVIDTAAWSEATLLRMGNEYVQ